MGLKAWANTNGTVWTAPSGSIVTSLVDHDNPLGIRPYTMRFQFSDYSYDPTSESWKAGSYWTQVSSSPNVWDYTHVSSRWNGGQSNLSDFYSRFNDHGNMVTILGANLIGVTNLAGLFEACSSLQQIGIIDTSTVENLSRVFDGCYNLRELPLLNLSSCSDLSYLCSKCLSLDTVASLDTSHIVNASYVFDGCASLVTTPSLDLQNATNVEYMFSNCSSLTTVGALNTPNATKFSSLFNNCSSLVTAPTFDTSNATDINGMFLNCSALTQAPTLNTRYVSRFDSMFYGCNSLQAVPLYNTVNANNVAHMFRHCYYVESGALALYTQMANQTVIPTSHQYCFENCGSRTTTGQAELAQIPTSWGGTMA